MPAAILFTVLLALPRNPPLHQRRRHLLPVRGLAEVALQVSVGLAMAIGLERLRGRTNSIVHDVGALIIAGARAAGIVFGLLFGENPLVTGEPVGGLFFNLILLGYCAAGRARRSALGADRAARRARMAYRTVAAVTAVVLALAYLSLEVRALLSRPVLTAGPITDAEQYTYSAVWLAFGVVLLLVGIFLRSQPVRLASAAVVLLTVVKVFLRRHGRPHRRLARALVHRPRAGAGRDRLALPAAAVSAAAPAALYAARGKSPAGSVAFSRANGHPCGLVPGQASAGKFPSLTEAAPS